MAPARRALASQPRYPGDLPAVSRYDEEPQRFSDDNLATGIAIGMLAQSAWNSPVYVPPVVESGGGGDFGGGGASGSWSDDSSSSSSSSSSDSYSSSDSSSFSSSD